MDTLQLEQKNTNPLDEIEPISPQILRELALRAGLAEDVVETTMEVIFAFLETDGISEQEKTDFLFQKWEHFACLNLDTIPQDGVNLRKGVKILREHRMAEGRGKDVVRACVLKHGHFYDISAVEDPYKTSSKALFNYIIRLERI